MMTIVSMLIFASALAVSIAVFLYTLAPAMPRIKALLLGQADTAALPQLVLRDRRRQPRMRLGSSQQQPSPAQRAAA